MGDGAGITRGLVQASVAGVLAARSILGIGDVDLPAPDGATGDRSAQQPAPTAGDPSVPPAAG